jgi:flagellar export protein FliJ
MARFHFSLDRVLEWRQTRLDAERLKLLELKKELSTAQSAIERIREDRAVAQRLTHDSSDMTGSDLRSLAAYVLGTRGQERKLQVRCEELDQRIAHQLQRVLKARQDHHLLEKLRERRLAEWSRESNQAIEKVADEAYLSRWISRREQARNSPGPSSGMLLLAACTALLHAQPMPVERAMASTLDRQRASVALMEASVAKQRDVTRRQVRKSAPVDDWPVAPTQSQRSSVGWDCEPLSHEQVAPLIERAAFQEGLDADLIEALIAQESGFKPCAVSRKGAEGLMQLMPATSQQLDVTSPFDPQQNINAGARLLRTLLQRYSGDLSLALGAYNAGPLRVDTYGGLPPFVETRNYVSRIIEKLEKSAPSPPEPSKR